jgi:hypothetical protein
MDAIQAEFDRLNNRSNLGKAVTDIDKCIALLQNARNQIAQGPYGVFPPRRTADDPRRPLFARLDTCAATAVDDYAARQGRQ